MTCIVGFRSPGGTWLGADSRMTGYQTEIRAGNLVKVLVNERARVAVALSGSYSAFCELRTVLETMPDGMANGATEHQVAVELVERFRARLTERGWNILSNKPGDEPWLDLALLVATPRNLYLVSGGLTIQSVTFPWGWAIGSGGEYARGCLWTTNQRIGRRVFEFERCQLALDAAAAHDAGCSRPYILARISPQGKAEQWALSAPHDSWQPVESVTT